MSLHASSFRPVGLGETGKFLRNRIKGTLLGAASNLPAWARRALLAGLAHSPEAYETLQILGRAHGVRDLRIAGDYGIIEGSIEDTAILRSYALEKRWAAQSNALFCDFFEQAGGGTYIDVGANIGLTTIPIARNPRVACKLFEPAPDNLRYLQINLWNNCAYDNVEIFNLALYDQVGTIEFELAEGNLGDHRVRIDKRTGDWGEEVRRVIEVAADRLDNILDLAKLGGPIAAKIDTQGAECQVVAGGATVLAAAELLQLEFWPYGIQRTDGDIGALTQYLRSNFSSGAIVGGDKNEPLLWRSSDFVIAGLLDFVKLKGGSPYEYLDVFLRKS